MKICPVCGFQNSDDSTFCSKCGSLLDQSSASVERIKSQQNNGNFDPTLKDGLYSLRGALYMLFLGTILTLIVVGLILLLIGLVRLINASEKMGGLNIKAAESFKKVRKWVIISLITGIVGIFVGTISVIYLLGYTLRSLNLFGSAQSSSMVLDGKVAIVVLAIYSFINLAVIIKTLLYLNDAFVALGNELSIIDLVNAGKYLKYYIIAIVISTISSLANLSVNAILSTTPNVPNYLYQLSLVTGLLLVVDIVAFVILLLALYTGYSGIDSYFYRHTQNF